MNTKLSLKSGDKLRCHQALPPIKWFDNSPFPLRIENGGDQEAIYKKWQCQPRVSVSKQRDVFDQKEKWKNKNSATFLVSSKLGCPSLHSYQDNSSSPPSFGSISKLRTINIKDQKEGKARRHSRHSNYSPWRREC